MAAYADSSDLVARYDARHIGDLAGDGGSRVDSGDFAADAKITAALLDASGMVDAALLQGKRYTTTQLEALTGNSLGWLKRITCSVAMYLLEDRRARPDEERRQRAWERAEEWLEKLRQGKNVFDIDDVKAAGVLEGTDGPTNVQLQDLGLIRDSVPRFYPSRAGRLPSGR